MSVNQLTSYINNQIVTLQNMQLDSIGNIWYESNDDLLNTWGDKKYKKYTSLDDISIDFANNTKTARTLSCFFNYQYGTFRDTDGYIGVIKTNTKNATEGYTLIKDVKFQPLLQAKYGALQLQHSFVDATKNINDTYNEYIKGFNEIDFTACAVYDEEGTLLEKESLQKVVDALNDKKAFACLFELIANENPTSFDIKINTMSYGDLHRIDVVSFGFDSDLNSPLGDGAVDLGLYLLTNKKMSSLSTKKLKMRLNNFINPAEDIGMLTLTYKENGDDVESSETIDISLTNISSVEDIKNAITTSIKAKREEEGYEGIYKNINVIVNNDEIVFVGDSNASGGTLTMSTSTATAGKIDLADVLYLDASGTNTTATESDITQPTLGKNCQYNPSKFITDYIKDINDNSNDECCIFASNVNYSFKDIENINTILSKMTRLLFVFVVRNALDTKYLSQYTANSDIFTGVAIVEGSDLVANQCLVRKLTLLGSRDVKQPNNSKQFGDLLPLKIPNISLTLNTKRAEYAANNGYEVAYYGKQQQENVFGMHNLSTSFGLTNVFYINYIIRAINNAELLYKINANGVTYTQAVSQDLVAKLKTLCMQLASNNMFNPDISEEKIVTMAQKLHVKAEEAIAEIRERGYFIISETPTEMSRRGSLIPTMWVMMAFGQALYGVNNKIGLMV